MEICHTLLWKLAEEQRCASVLFQWHNSEGSNMKNVYHKMAFLVNIVKIFAHSFASS